MTPLVIFINNELDKDKNYTNFEVKVLARFYLNFIADTRFNYNHACITNNNQHKIR